MFSESRNDLAVIGERAVNAIQTEISQSKLIFEEDARNRLPHAVHERRSPGACPSGRTAGLPIIDANTTIIGPDPGPNAITNRTGNSLIVVRQLAPISVAYDHDANAGTRGHQLPGRPLPVPVLLSAIQSTRNFGGLRLLPGPGPGQEPDRRRLRSAQRRDHEPGAALVAAERRDFDHVGVGSRKGGRRSGLLHHHGAGRSRGSTPAASP